MLKQNRTALDLLITEELTKEGGHQSPAGVTLTGDGCVVP